MHGRFGIDLKFDLDSLLGLKGLLLDVSGSWRSGSNLSRRNIGTTFNTSTIFSSETVQLYAIALEQSLFDDPLDIRMGRFGTGDDFLASALHAIFVSGAFSANQSSVPLNIPSFSSYPLGTWGLRAKALPTEPRREAPSRHRS